MFSSHFIETAPFRLQRKGVLHSLHEL